MTPSESLAAVVGMLALPDDRFFVLDGAATTALQAQVAKIVQPSPLSAPPSSAREPLPELRVIGAPARLDWQQRATFPVLLAEVRGSRREWEVHSLQNRRILLSNLESGAVEVALLIDRGRRRPTPPPSRSGEPPDALNATLSSIGVYRYDLLQWFERDQVQGRLALTELDYDLLSNTVLVHARGKDAPPTGGASLQSPSRIAVPSAPATPGAAGVRWQVPAAVSATAPAPLRVEIRLPRARVTAIDARPGAGRPLVLAASLLLVQLDTPVPVLVHLAVVAEPGAADTVESTFSLDLRAALAGRAAAGNWLVYLVVGDTVTGPRALRIEPS
jgi:hypothetical protein